MGLLLLLLLLLLLSLLLRFLFWPSGCATLPLLLLLMLAWALGEEDGADDISDIDWVLSCTCALPVVAAVLYFSLFLLVFS